MRKARFGALAVGVVFVATACGGNGDKKAADGCSAGEGVDDPAYVVEVQQPVAQDKPVLLMVTKNGQPLVGADVCVASVMVDMEDMDASEEAKEVSPGSYEADTGFEMDGIWTGTVTIVDDNQPPVAKPVTIEVTK